MLFILCENFIYICGKFKLPIEKEMQSFRVRNIILNICRTMTMEYWFEKNWYEEIVALT